MTSMRSSANSASRDVAAFVVEPIQGKGRQRRIAGVLGRGRRALPPPRDAARRRRSADRARSTGKLWAHEHYGLVPDIITISKALSGGFVPVGAMVSSPEVADKVYSSMQRAMVHSSTFKNNPLAMVAGLATLSMIDDENLVDRARMTGRRLRKGARSAHRAPRELPGGAWQGADDRPRLRRAEIESASAPASDCSRRPTPGSSPRSSSARCSPGTASSPRSRPTR